MLAFYGSLESMETSFSLNKSKQILWNNGIPIANYIKNPWRNSLGITESMDDSLGILEWSTVVRGGSIAII